MARTNKEQATKMAESHWKSVNLSLSEEYKKGFIDGLEHYFNLTDKLKNELNSLNNDTTYNQ